MACIFVYIHNARSLLLSCPTKQGAKFRDLTVNTAYDIISEIKGGEIMTQKELAALLGVTPATVSKAIKGAPDISTATRKRVLAAMEEHGMTIERERRTHGKAVLVVTPEFGSEFYAMILSSLHRSLESRGLMMLTVSLEMDFTKVIHTVKQALRMIPGICGAVLIHCDDEIHFDDEGHTIADIEFDRPVVYYGRRHDCVYSSFEEALYQAVLYLKEHGRRRIAFAGETLTSDKANAFRMMLQRLELPVDERYIHTSSLRFGQAGADGFQTLFSLPEPPDAIICGYDYIALGVLNSAEAAGIEVPRELAVIGSDNLRAAGAYRLGLSTIGDNHERVADALVELLMWRIANPDAPERQITLPAELYLRATT